MSKRSCQSLLVQGCWIVLLLGACWALAAPGWASGAQATTPTILQSSTDSLRSQQTAQDDGWVKVSPVFRQVQVSPDFRLVQNDYYQFSLSVPKGWLSTEGLSKKDYYDSSALSGEPDAKSWVFAYQPPDYAQSQVSVELFVSEQKFPVRYEQKRRRQLQENHQDQFRQFYPDAEVVDFTVIEEEEQNALSFDLLLPLEGMTIRQSYYLTSGPKFGYELRLSRPDDCPAELRALLDAIAASLETPPPLFRSAAQRDPWKYYVFPALFCALTAGLVIRAFRTSRRLRGE